MGTTRYDAIVIGAGPGGCMAALTLARRGVRTLVVDKLSKRRWKVCGCCIGTLGQRTLREHDLDAVLLHARPLDALTLAAKGGRATVPLNGFVGLSRESLDASLADAAMHAGAAFRWNTGASATPDGALTLSDGETMHAGVVIDASGLRGQRVDESRVSPRARIGLGLTTTAARCAPGELTMAVARAGYLGRVALPDGRVDFAAAVQPTFVRRSGSPIAALRAIWRSAGLDETDVPDGPWRGTPALTRSRRAQDGRILRVGDAAGYVEPFTGEGMSWALHAASNIVGDAVACTKHGPSASNWARTLHALLALRHRRCRAVSLAVRSPGLVSMGVRAASIMPALGAAGASRLSGARGLA
ncbi:MAG: NAD(P)/FAD-dependent oxidoreductase [Phycisphaerales bacterium JB060]